jgi:hypothetical protein
MIMHRPTRAKASASPSTASFVSNSKTGAGASLGSQRSQKVCAGSWPLRLLPTDTPQFNPQSQGDSNMAATQTATKTAPPAPPAPIAEPDAPSPVRRPVRPLAEGRFKIIRSSETDYANLFGAVTPTGTPMADVQVSDFWAPHAWKMHVGDQIEIHTDDASYFARLLVRHVSGSGTNKRAIVSLLEAHEFGEVRYVPTYATHKVEHRGPHLKFCVVRLSDGSVISQGHDNEGAAGAALANMMRREVTVR